MSIEMVSPSFLPLPLTAEELLFASPRSFAPRKLRPPLAVMLPATRWFGFLDFLPCALLPLLSRLGRLLWRPRLPFVAFR